jgi:6-phosphofructokinase 1
MPQTVALLAGGGPAPGINAVISSVSKVFLRHYFRVIAVHEGFKGLLAPKPDFVEMTYELADRLFTQGGSVVQMSRHKPKEIEFSDQFFRQQNIVLLVSIGGDDTASTANNLAKYLSNKNLNIKNIHVPKTIDNDLPLPPGRPTFGFTTARDEGVYIAKTLYEDARTSGNWFVITAMGRSAGHLAFGIGAAAHFPMIIVPEMFYRVPITADRIANLVISSIIKRKLLGINYGAAIISEGVFHFMTDEEITRTGASFTFDAHGHPELFNVSKAHVFNTHIQSRLKQIGLNIKTRPVEIGFELRCAQPSGYDLLLCTQLGIGVYQLYQTGHTACMVSVDHLGHIEPLYLHQLQDQNGRIPSRPLDIHGADVQQCFTHNLHFIEPDDYTQTAMLIKNPEEFDLNVILGL